MRQFFCEKGSDIFLIFDICILESTNSKKLVRLTNTSLLKRLKNLSTNNRLVVILDEIHSPLAPILLAFSSHKILSGIFLHNTSPTYVEYDTLKMDMI